MQLDEYRKMAEVEDRMWYYRSLHRHLLGWILPLFPKEPVSVLDAGCGTGGLLLKLREARPGWDLHGIDFSEEACRRAAARKVAAIRQASVTGLPFEDGQFDAVVSADVLCQVDHPADAVGEIVRCLRPGGIFLMNLPAYPWLWSYHDEAAQTRKRYRRPEVLGLLAAGGLEVQVCTHWNCLPFPLILARRKLFPPRPEQSSDVRMYPAPVEAILDLLMRWEHQIVRRGARLPYGSSLFAVARKPGQAGTEEGC